MARDVPLTAEGLRAAQDLNGRDLLVYFARRIESPDDAAALFNELLEVMWRQAGRAPQDPEQLRMWMFGIASRLAANHRRASRRRIALTARLAAELPAHHPDIDLRLEVRAAIGTLPARQREILRLIHWEGFTQEEIAQILGIPSSTVRGQYQRARQALAILLDGASMHEMGAAAGS